MTYKSDEEIHSEVLFQLGWDSRLKQSEVAVTVKKGVVTLTGTVDSYAKKLAAQKAAHRVPIVLDVANDIEVKVTGRLRRTDSEIARAIRHALEWDVLVPSYKIHSTVANGWVTIEGEVEYYTSLIARPFHERIQSGDKTTKKVEAYLYFTIWRISLASISGRPTSLVRSESNLSPP